MGSESLEKAGRRRLFQVFIVLLCSTILCLLYAAGVLAVLYQDMRQGRSIASSLTRFTLPGVSDKDAARVFLELDPGACNSVRRYGHAGDGGWDVCIDSLSKPCVVYSVGISDDWSFDTAMADFGCEVHSFDPFIKREDGHNFGPGTHFHDKGLAPTDKALVSNGKLQALQNIMQELRHKKIDVLKMDTEGWEWSLLEDWFARGLLGPEVCPPFRVLAMEVHFDKAAGVVRTQAQMVELLRTLRRAGFRVVSREENWRYCRQANISGLATMRNCLDVSFVYTGTVDNGDCFVNNAVKAVK